VQDSTLPTRAKNVLKRLECETINDVIRLTPSQILRAKWAGKKVLSYIEAWLGSYGLSLIIPGATLPSGAGFPLLNGYFQLQGQIYDYFGYHEDWVEIPLEDRTEMHWMLQQNENGRGIVTYHTEPLTVETIGGGACYNDSIYTQRFLPKWVYRGKDFTMICVDTHTDGNKFLAVFSNDKEVEPTPEMIKAAKKWDLFGDIVVPEDMGKMGFTTLEEIRKVGR
jgi:hypothetical protein